MTYFEVKVRYSRQSEDGRMQKVSETFLVSTLTFGDAEQKALKEIEPYVFINGEQEVVSIKKVQYQELLLDKVGELTDKDTAYYKVKVVLNTIDDNGKEVKQPYYLLVQDTDVESAHSTVKRHFSNSITDYTIDDVVKTKICDVIDK